MNEESKLGGSCHESAGVQNRPAPSRPSRSPRRLHRARTARSFRDQGRQRSQRHHRWSRADSTRSTRTPRSGGCQRGPFAGGSTTPGSSRWKLRTAALGGFAVTSSCAAGQSVVRLTGGPLMWTAGSRTGATARRYPVQLRGIPVAWRISGSMYAPARPGPESYYFSVRVSATFDLDLNVGPGVSIDETGRFAPRRGSAIPIPPDPLRAQPRQLDHAAAELAGIRSPLPPG